MKIKCEELVAQVIQKVTKKKTKKLHGGLEKPKKLHGNMYIKPKRIW